MGGIYSIRIYNVSNGEGFWNLMGGMCAGSD